MQLSFLWIKTGSEHNAFLLLNIRVTLKLLIEKWQKKISSLTFDLPNFNFYIANACKPFFFFILFFFPARKPGIDTSSRAQKWSRFHVDMKFL